MQTGHTSAFGLGFDGTVASRNTLLPPGTFNKTSVVDRVRIRTSRITYENRSERVQTSLAISMLIEACLHRRCSLTQRLGHASQRFTGSSRGQISQGESLQ